MPSAKAAGQTPPDPGSSLPLSVHSPRTTLGVLPNTCGDRQPHAGSQRQQQQKGVSVPLPRSPALRSWPSGCPSALRHPRTQAWWLRMVLPHTWRITKAWLASHTRTPSDRTQALSPAATCLRTARVTWHAEPHSELQAPFPLHDSDGLPAAPTEAARFSFLFLKRRAAF